MVSFYEHVPSRLDLYRSNESVIQDQREIDVHADRKRRATMMKIDLRSMLMKEVRINRENVYTAAISVIHTIGDIIKDMEVM